MRPVAPYYLYRRLHGGHRLVDGGERWDSRHEDVVADQHVALDQSVCQRRRGYCDVGGYLESKRGVSCKHGGDTNVRKRMSLWKYMILTLCWIPWEMKNQINVCMVVVLTGNEFYVHSNEFIRCLYSACDLLTDSPLSWHCWTPSAHLSVSGGLWSRADGGDRCVGVGGGQGHCGQGGDAGLALLPLVCHEGRQRVELFLTLPTQEHVLVVCHQGQTQHVWGMT